MTSDRQATQTVRITVTGERSDGTQLEQVFTATAGECLKIGDDGFLTKDGTIVAVRE